jgi:hypothetical protein
VAIVYALRDRRGRVLVGLAVAAALVPLALALAGADYLLDRNVIALYVPLALAVAAGLGFAGRLGLAGAAAICAIAVVVNVEVATEAKLQRDDWRGAAAALVPGTAGPSAIVVTPDFAKKPLRLYAGSLPPVPAAGADVREVEVIGNARPVVFRDPPPPPGFTLASRKVTPSYELIRFTAPAPVHVTPAGLGASRLGTKPPAILLRKGLLP